MAHTLYADLEGFEAPTGLRFHYAEWWSPDSPFVLVRYSLDGRLVELGLRMDMDKRVFLDHLDDRELDANVQSRALEVWELVVKQREQHRSHRLPQRMTPVVGF